ncbi:uncharacterized protein N7482_003471 [Penicillium canariense]|uniref:Xylanolytic transcriptional activator regulatory domain-containing protein n=1 Tax=Penicillium canariense TaxID=189055 RepID=A0A9W9LNP3_9EURO|nr:uncharacterized protein N7482_003471 [Penicillium canariense]KAJ5167877.1 hypothetical protein N7482_003471 [Penicillium canariense]
MTIRDPPQFPPGEGLAPQQDILKPLSDGDMVPTPKPASVANTSSTLGPRSQAKVAIPRSRGGSPQDTTAVYRVLASRVAHARQNVVVIPRQVDKLSEKAQDYENLLKDLGHLVETRAADRIKSLLDKHGTDVEYSSNSNQSHSVTPNDDVAEAEAEAEAEENDFSSPSSIGSLEAIDRAEEDLNRNENSRATGFMGKISEVTWMQRLQREAVHRSHGLPGSLEAGQSKQQDDDLALHAVSYHLDDLDISVPGPIELYAMPPRHMADKLFEDYLRTVHPFFPIINRPLFTAQYRTFFDSNARPGDKWIAILNMIFAIATKHAHLLEAPWRGDERDHLVYLTRARILSMNGDVLFSHPDLQQVQVEGLIAFYLLASDQINRAWRISSLAVRSAITLGINMKSSSPTTPNISKEARYRVWWCLYTFEHMLGIMTGRATCILDGICTTPLPIPFEEEQLHEQSAAELLNKSHLRDERINRVMASAWVRHMPLNPAGGKELSHPSRNRDNSWVKSLPFNSGLSYLFYCDLAVIVQEIINRVYSMDCVMVPWTHIENRIGELRFRIDLWYHSIPPFLDFTRKEEDGPELLRAKLALAFHYYSAQITLGRPCLCRRDAQQKKSAHDSNFSHEMAVLTLEAAERMLDLIPDEPNAIQLYEISPWWCILHYLMQATTVLLLELSFGTVHVPASEQNIILQSKKAVRWLYAMSDYSIASRRAWQLCDISLRRLAAGMKFDVSDMPSSSYHPAPASTLSLTDPQDQDQNITQADPGFWGTGLQDLSLSNQGSGAAQDPIPADLFQYPTSDSMAWLVADSQATDELYFPYDPISGEFIRSFFPHANEDETWDQT